MNTHLERLVAILDELKQRDKHPLFPFVGAWSPKLTDVAGEKFKVVAEFHRQIISVLRKDWLQPELVQTAEYYQGISAFQQEYNYPLRIFSLNYDLCLEQTCQDTEVERGFDEQRVWSWSRFDRDENSDVAIYLYKLHGSVDWKYDDGGNLTYIDNPHRIEGQGALIFGTSYKLQYLDPFLFCIYELRRWTLDPDAHLIVCVGYGFEDEHINAILGQSLKRQSARKLLAVSPSSEKKQQVIADRLGVADTSQVACLGCTASEFFGEKLSLPSLSSYLETGDEPF